MKQPTHNEKVLALLADGAWHSHHEIYALHVIGHSRISELRRKHGYVIEERRDGDLYLYRLVRSPQPPVTEPAPPIPAGGCGEPAQLSLDEVAA